MNGIRIHDSWHGADAYEEYIGRWSRLVASELVAALPRGGRWLDIGCGSGALLQAVLAHAEPEAVTGVDRSLDYVRHARASTPDRRASFAAVDASALPFAEQSFDVAVSGLVFNFLPDPAAAARDARRCLRPGGLLAIYLWDYADGMELIRRFWDAAIAVDPASAAADEGRRFPLCRPAALDELLRSSGMTDVAVSSITVPTPFRDFDDLWLPFLGGQGPAPGYVAQLPAERRELLRDTLRSSLPAGADGAIRLSARAWVATGRR